MKKVILALAIVSVSFAACNNGESAAAATEVVVDSAAAVTETVVDSAAATIQNVVDSAAAAH